MLPSVTAMPEKDFDVLLLEAVDEGLASIGESSKLAMYYHLEKRFGVYKEEIPVKVDAFAQALEQIFGPGAQLLEILMMKRLYEKAGGRFTWSNKRDFTLTEYVAAAKQSFLERERASKTQKSSFRPDYVPVQKCGER